MHNFRTLRLCRVVLPMATVLVGAALLAAQQTPPIPDIRTLISDVEKHQKHLDQLREDYTYTAQITTEQLDGSGRVTKTETLEMEHFFVSGHMIGRRVKKDGKPLDGRELEKETERVTKLVEKAQATPRDQALEGRMIRIGRLLELMEVSNPRRQQLRGRSALVFDFAGRKNAKTSGMEEDVSKKLAGTIWIDEQDRQVAHLEVRFNDNFRVGAGFVATVQKGSNFSFDQALVGDGLWMPVGSEGTVQARVLLLKGIRERFRERDVDYKRFHAEAEQGKEARVVGR